MSGTVTERLKDTDRSRLNEVFASDFGVEVELPETRSLLHVHICIGDEPAGDAFIASSAAS